MGLDAVGVASSTSALPLRSRAAFLAREAVARHVAVWDRWFPPSTMLGPREATPGDAPARP
jgi:hypothetical protein